MKFNKITFFLIVLSTLSFLFENIALGQGRLKTYLQMDKAGWKIGMNPTQEGFHKDREDGIFKEFDMVWKQKDNLYVVKILKKTSAKKYELFSWLTDHNGIKISKTYTDIGDFHEGLAEVSYSDKCQSCFPDRYDFVDINQASHGFIDETGREVVKLQYRRIATKFHEGKAAVGYWPNSIFFVNKQGGPLFNKKFKDAGPFINGLADVITLDGNENYIDAKGNLLVPKVLSFVRPYEKGVIRAYKTLQSKIGFWDDKNENLISPQYDDFSYEIWPGKILIKQSNKFGFIDCKSGKLLIPVNYDDVRTARSDKFIWMKADKEWHKIDVHHHINAKITAKDIKTIDENLLIFSVNDKWGLVNNNGKILRNTEFDYIEPQFVESRTVVLKKNKYGYISSSGRLIIPAIYDKISHFSNGQVQGLKGNYVYYLNDHNNVLSRSLSSSMIKTIFYCSGGAIILIGIFLLFKNKV